MAQITLKAARVNAGMTQQVAAEKLEVSLSTLKNWENGITFPNQPNIMRLCDLYGVTYDDIFFASKLAKS